MENFAYYFEKAAQDFGIALFFAAFLIILVTLTVRAFQKDQELYGFLSDTINKKATEVERLNHNLNGNAKARTTFHDIIGHYKGLWHKGHTHAEA